MSESLAGEIDYKAASESERKAHRAIFEAFGREIPPELRDVQGEPVTCFTNEQACKLVQEFAATLGLQIDDAVQAALVRHLRCMPSMPGGALAVFAEKHDDILWAEKVIASPQETEAIWQQVERLLSLARETGGDRGFSPWCDLAALYREIDAIEQIEERKRSEDDRERLKFLTRVTGNGLMRRHGGVPEPQRVLDLADGFPNFAAPIRFVAEQAALSKLRQDRHFGFPPILLSGPPGIGKTHFASELARRLEARIETLDMASQSCGFTLAGLDRGWSSARTGLVFEALRQGPTLSPVIVLDELDKSSRDSRSDPLGPLHALLEPRSARSFRDECAGFPVNASQVLWIATANDVAAIPAPLLSRFRVFEIGEPGPRESEAIAEQIFRSTVEGLTGAPSAMPDAWKRRMHNRSLREIRFAIQEAVGRAALRATSGEQSVIEILGNDILFGEHLKQNRIGF